jgi:DNA modification methylase
MGGLILGNCLDGLRGLPPESVDLTPTSPPYGDLRPGMSLPPETFDEVSGELWRITKEGGIVCWQEADEILRDQGRPRSGGYSLSSYRHAVAFQDLGFTVWDVIITGTTGHRYPVPRRYKRPLTYVFVLSKGRPKTVNLIRDRPNKQPGMLFRHNERGADGRMVYRKTNYVVQPFGVRNTVWLYPPQGHCQERDVQMVFPALMHEALARDLIYSYSEENDLVLDPFAGAATTGKMAVLMHRRFTGFEISPEYYEIGIHRLEAAMVAARRARMEELAARWS